MLCMELSKVDRLYYKQHDKMYRQLKARRVLSLFNHVSLKTRSALWLYKVYGNSALLVLNRTLLKMLMPFKLMLLGLIFIISHYLLKFPDIVQYDYNYSLRQIEFETVIL